MPNEHTTRAPDTFDFDVALSFAGEERQYVQAVAETLRAAGVRVFYDRYEETDLWGKNLYEHLADVYSRKARYCVMFISKNYAAKVWTNLERQHAQSRALSEGREYILPARFDDTEVPGIAKTVGYVDLKAKSPSDLAAMIVEKLEETAKNPRSATSPFNELQIVKIDENGHLVQSDDEIALLFSEMLTEDPPPDAFPITVDKDAMINAIGLEDVQNAVEDFSRLYSFIDDSRELRQLISNLEHESNLSVDKRKLRLDAKKVAGLWQPIESKINTGLICLRNGIGRHYWLSTAEKACEASRAFIDIYFQMLLHPYVPEGLKVDVWRDAEPRMATSIRLSEDEVDLLERLLGGPATTYLMTPGFTASEFSETIIRRKFAPRLICEALSAKVPIGELVIADRLFTLTSWSIGLG